METPVTSGINYASECRWQKQPQRVLWKTATTTTTDESYNATVNFDLTVANVAQPQNESLTVIRQRFRVEPIHRTIFQLCANSVVVVQEFVLTTYLMVHHRVMLLPTIRNKRHEMYMDLSNAAMLLSLMLSVYYSSRADQTQQQDRRTKILQRTCDALVLGLVLRWIAAILQNLTASFSSDTVESLALTGMLLHLIFCDYSYANGRDHIYRAAIVTNKARPPFLGGTVSLNAALFSTTMLLSRLPNDSVSSVYWFVSLSIVIFALYPATRHAISLTFPTRYHGATWMITALLCLSTFAQVQLLDISRVQYIFLSAIAILGLILPLWKYNLQKTKVLFQGPWDISQRSSM